MGFSFNGRGRICLNSTFPIRTYEDESKGLSMLEQWNSDVFSHPYLVVMLLYGG